MNKKHALIALMTTAALSLTGCPSAQNDQKDVNPGHGGATHAYMFSGKQMNFYRWNNLAPPIVCVPEQDRVLVVTDVVRLGTEHARYMRNYPDATTESIGNPDKIVTLNNPDGSWKGDVSSQIDQKISPDDYKSRANIVVCIQRLNDALNKLYPEPEGGEPSRPEIDVRVTRNAPKGLTPVS